jgi:hypothetical protein
METVEDNLIIGFNQKCCSLCKEVYPRTKEYFHTKTKSGLLVSRCKKCTNAGKTFLDVRKQPRSLHWKGDLLICATCNESKILDEFSPDKRNIHRACKNNDCRVCSNKKHVERAIKLYDKNDFTFYINRLYYGVSDRCRNNIKYKNLGFDLTKESLVEMFNKQNGLCAISGVKMTHYSGKNKGIHPTNISIDRIDSSKGYYINNTQLVCTSVNMMKSNLSLTDLVFFCKNIIHHQNKSIS